MPFQHKTKDKNLKRRRNDPSYICDNLTSKKIDFERYCDSLYFQNLIRDNIDKFARR